jgi:hypothetical protein
MREAVLMRFGRSLPLVLLTFLIIAIPLLSPITSADKYITTYEQRGASINKRYYPGDVEAEHLDIDPDWGNANNFTITILFDSNECTGLAVTVFQENNWNAGSNSIKNPSLSKKYTFDDQDIQDGNEIDDDPFDPWSQSGFMALVENLDNASADDLGHSLSVWVVVNWWISIKERDYSQEDDDTVTEVVCFSVVFLFFIILFVAGFTLVRMDIGKHLKSLSGAFEGQQSGNRVEEAKKEVMPKFFLRTGIAALILLLIAVLWGLQVFFFELCNFIVYLGIFLLTVGMIVVFVESDVRIARKIDTETKDYASHIMNVLALTSNLTVVQEYNRTTLILDLRNNTGGPIHNIALAPQFQSGSATLTPPQINIPTMSAGEMRQESIKVQKFTDPVVLSLRGFGIDQNSTRIPLDTNTVNC